MAAASRPKGNTGHPDRLAVPGRTCDRRTNYRLRQSGRQSHRVDFGGILPPLLPPVNRQVEQPIAVIHRLDAAPRRPASLEDIGSLSQVADDVHHAHFCSSTPACQAAFLGQHPPVMYVPRPAQATPQWPPACLSRCRRRQAGRSLYLVVNGNAATLSIAQAWLALCASRKLVRTAETRAQRQGPSYSFGAGFVVVTPRCRHSPLARLCSGPHQVQK